MCGGQEGGDTCAYSLQDPTRVASVLTIFDRREHMLKRREERLKSSARYLLPLMALVLTLAFSTTPAFAGRLTDTTAGLSKQEKQAESGGNGTSSLLNRYGLSPRPYRGKVVAQAPSELGAFAYLVDPTGVFCNTCVVDASQD